MARRDHERKLLSAAWTPFEHDPRNPAHQAQAALYSCPKRFVAVCAGRGSGKSAISKRKLVRALAVKKPWSDPRYFYAAPTYMQAKRIAWNEFCALVPEYWIAPRGLSAADLCIRTIFGSELWLVGMDKPQRVEGVQWDGCVIDESSDIKPGTFDRSVMPALTWRNGWCWRIGVPKRFGVGAIEFKSFFVRAAAHDLEDAAAFSWSSEDVLPKASLVAARANLDLLDYREQFLAMWQDLGGGVFHAFSHEHNVRPCPYDPNKTIIVGSDFNVDPMAWVLCHRYDGRLEVFDEIWVRNTNTPACLRILYDRYKDHKGGFEFYGDATGRSRDTATSSTDYALILNDVRFRILGRTICYLHSNPPLADRFAATNALICNSEGDRRFHVDPRCRHLIEDLASRQYQPGTRKLPTQEGDIGHSSDALGYIIFKMFPIRVTVTDAPEIVVSGAEFDRAYQGTYHSHQQMSVEERIMRGEFHNGEN